MWRFSAFITLAILGGLLLSGCQSTPLRNDPTSYEPVRVGVILPHTGVNKNYGDRIRKGIELAAEELNFDRGIAGRQIELVYADNESSPERSVELVRDLYDHQNIAALVAGYSSNDIRAIAPEVQRFNLPTVNTIATGNDLGNGKHNRVLFRAAFTDAQQGHSLAAYLWFWRKIQRLGIMTDISPDAAYARDNAQAIGEKFREYGGWVVKTVEYDEKMTNFLGPVREMLLHNPEAIFIPASPEVSGKIVAALRHQGFGGLIVGPDTWDEALFLESCGATPGDCAFISFYADEYDSPQHNEFRDNFRRKYFYYPGSCEAQGYDSMKLLATALGNAGTVEEFQKNLLSIHGYAGATGQFSMLKNGEIDRTLVLKTLRPKNRSGRAAEARFRIAFPYSKLLQFDELDSESQEDESSSFNIWKL